MFPFNQPIDAETDCNQGKPRSSYRTPFPEVEKSHRIFARGVVLVAISALRASYSPSNEINGEPFKTNIALGNALIADNEGQQTLVIPSSMYDTLQTWHSKL